MQNQKLEKELVVRSYARSFLDITAAQIDAWADKTETRPLLAVFLRKLVFSTSSGIAITKINFPGHDNAQRPGWDGEVEADGATTWLPSGKSGWEFGCSDEPQKKAESDFNTRTTKIDSGIRENTTFVFVTPRNWPGKDKWEKEKRDMGKWKDVRAFDASNLEQWLEQSVSAQIWLAESLGIPTKGICSLEECWERWANVTDPAMTKTLFSGEVETYKNDFMRWLKNPSSTPYTVASNSPEESLAYLVCMFEAIDNENISAGYTARALIISDPSALCRVAQTTSKFIPILTSPEVEEASTGIHKKQHTIIIRRRNVAKRANVELDLVDYEPFKKGLTEMGVEEEKIHNLRRESGQSLTILRRCLSNIPAIESPLWAKNTEVAKKLAPLVLIGAWDSESKADNEILSLLTGSDKNSIETLVAELRTLDDSPVWSIRKFRGFTSKLDVLYAVHHFFIDEHLKNFFKIAGIVLSERDPSIDLPDEERCMANMYGKTRDHSKILRSNTLETLVLLAIHGNGLFKERMGFDVEMAVKKLVRQLLTFERETWMSQKDDLPFYAEAAPNDFLEIVEEGLSSKNTQLLSLLKPVESSIFGSECPRVGLLWALEMLSWKPEQLLRVSKILAQMSEIKITDNWNNTPENTLKSIFLFWMPQTAASIDERCQVLEKIVSSFEHVGWRLCVAQFNGRSTVQGKNYRPRWRTDAYGAGQPIERKKALTFARKALDLAINWSSHDENTLGDLVSCMAVLNQTALDQTAQERICKKIDEWILTNPSNEQKEILREKIRSNFFAHHRSAREREDPELDNSIQKIYRQLEASDLVVRYRWLFARYWVEEPCEEFEDEELNSKSCDEKSAYIRTKAITKIWETLSVDGIIQLCQRVDSASIVGSQLAISAPADFDPVEFIVRIITEPSLSPNKLVDSYLSGYLSRLDENALESSLLLLLERYEQKKSLSSDAILRILKCAPFKKLTWRMVDRLSTALQEQYWLTVNPSYLTDEEELREFVEKFLFFKRPKAALIAGQFALEKLDSSMIVQLLKDLPTDSSDRETNIHVSVLGAFAALDMRAELSSKEFAELEFLYLSALEFEARGIPNLERQLSETPSLFAYAVGLFCKRKDEGEDPPEWKITDEKARENLAIQACRFINKVKRIPGTGEDGKIDLEKLKSWIKEAQQLCNAYGRKDAGDTWIGELLSKSNCDARDGIWPAIEIREVLEEIGNPRIRQQMIIGLYNQRGVQCGLFAELGNKERDLATMYRDWSNKIKFDWPFTAQLLEEIAQNRDSSATWCDANTNLNKRLGGEI